MEGDYKKLLIWQRGMILTEQVYALIATMPQDEKYALADQMKRAAISVPSNIAEGHGRQSKKEFAKFLYIARGSLAELETQLLICQRLYNDINNRKAEEILTMIPNLNKMIGSFIRYLFNNDSKKSS